MLPRHLNVPSLYPLKCVSERQEGKPGGHVTFVVAKVSQLYCICCTASAMLTGEKQKCRGCLPLAVLLFIQQSREDRAKILIQHTQIHSGLNTQSCKIETYGEVCLVIMGFVMKSNLFPVYHYELLMVSFCSIIYQWHI